jgi:hypothetical protein
MSGVIPEESNAQKAALKGWPTSEESMPKGSPEGLAYD